MSRKYRNNNYNPTSSDIQTRIEIRNDLQKLWDKMVEMNNNIYSQVFDALTERNQNQANNINGYYPNKNGYSFENFKMQNENYQKGINEIINQNSRMESNVYSEIASLKDELIYRYNEMFNRVNSLEEIGNANYQGISEALQNSWDNFNKMYNYLSNVEQNIKSGQFQIDNNFRSYLQNLRDEIISFSENFSNSLFDYLSQSNDYINYKIQESIDNTSNQSKYISDKIDEATNYTVENTNYIINSLDQAKNELQSNQSRLLDAIINNNDDIRNVNNTIIDSNNDLSLKIEDANSRAINYYSNILENVRYDLLNAQKEVSDKINSIKISDADLSRVSSSVKEVIYDNFYNINNELETLRKKIEQEISPAINSTKETFINSLNNFIGEISANNMAILNSLDNLSNENSVIASNLYSSIENKIKENTNEYINIVDSMINGLHGDLAKLIEYSNSDIKSYVDQHAQNYYAQLEDVRYNLQSNQEKIYELVSNIKYDDQLFENVKNTLGSLILEKAGETSHALNGILTKIQNDIQPEIAYTRDKISETINSMLSELASNSKDTLDALSMIESGNIKANEEIINKIVEINNYGNSQLYEQINTVYQALSGNVENIVSAKAEEIKNLFSQGIDINQNNFNILGSQIDNQSNNYYEQLEDVRFNLQSNQEKIFDLIKNIKYDDKSFESIKTMISSLILEKAGETSHALNGILEKIENDIQPELAYTRDKISETINSMLSELASNSKDTLDALSMIESGNIKANEEIMNKIVEINNYGNSQLYEQINTVYEALSGNVENIVVSKTDEINRSIDRSKKFYEEKIENLKNEIDLKHSEMINMINDPSMLNEQSEDLVEKINKINSKTSSDLMESIMSLKDFIDKDIMFKLDEDREFFMNSINGLIAELSASSMDVINSLAKKTSLLQKDFKNLGKKYNAESKNYKSLLNQLKNEINENDRLTINKMIELSNYQGTQLYEKIDEVEASTINTNNILSDLNIAIEKSNENTNKMIDFYENKVDKLENVIVEQRKGLIDLMNEKNNLYKEIASLEDINNNINTNVEDGIGLSKAFKNNKKQIDALWERIECVNVSITNSIMSLEESMFNYVTEKDKEYIKKFEEIKSYSEKLASDNRDDLTKENIKRYNELRDEMLTKYNEVTTYVDAEIEKKFNELKESMRASIEEVNNINSGIIDELIKTNNNFNNLIDSLDSKIGHLDKGLSELSCSQNLAYNEFATALDEMKQEYSILVQEIKNDQRRIHNNNKNIHLLKKKLISQNKNLEKITKITSEDLSKEIKNIYESQENLKNEIVSIRENNAKFDQSIKDKIIYLENNFNDILNDLTKKLKTETKEDIDVAVSEQSSKFELLFDETISLIESLRKDNNDSINKIENFNNQISKTIDDADKKIAEIENKISDGKDIENIYSEISNIKFNIKKSVKNISKIHEKWYENNKRMMTLEELLIEQTKQLELLANDSKAINDESNTKIVNLFEKTKDIVDEIESLKKANYSIEELIKSNEDKLRNDMNSSFDKIEKSIEIKSEDYESRLLTMFNEIVSLIDSLKQQNNDFEIRVNEENEQLNKMINDLSEKSESIVNSKIGNIISEINENKDEISKLYKVWISNNNRLKSLEESLVVQSNELKDLYETTNIYTDESNLRFDSLINEAERINQEISELKSENEIIENKIEEKQAEIRNELKVSIGLVESSMKENISEIEEKLSATFSEIISVIDAIKNENEQFANKVREENESINFLLGETNGKLSELKDEINFEVNERVNSVKTDIEISKEEINKLYNIWLSNNEKIKHLEKAILEQSNELKELGVFTSEFSEESENAIEIISNRIEEINISINDLKSQNELIENKIEERQAEIKNELKSSISLLETSLKQNISEIEEKLSATFSEIISVIDAIKNENEQFANKVKEENEIINSMIAESNVKFAELNENLKSELKDDMTSLRSDVDSNREEIAKLYREWVNNSNKIKSLEDIILEQSDALKQLVMTTEEYTEETNAKFVKMQEDIEGINNEISILKQTNEMIENKIEAKQAEIKEELKSSIETLETSLKQNISEIEEKLSNTFNEIISVIDAIKNENEQFANKVKEENEIINSMIAESNVKFAELNENLKSELKDDMTSLRSDVDSNREEIAKLYREWVNNSNKIKSLEDIILEQSDALKQLVMTTEEYTEETNAKFVKMQEDIEGINNEISILKQTNEMIENKIEAKQAEIKEELKSSIETLETSLKQNISEIEEKLEISTKETLDIINNFNIEISERIISLQKQVVENHDYILEVELSEIKEKLGHIIQDVSSSKKIMDENINRINIIENNLELFSNRSVNEDTVLRNEIERLLEQNKELSRSIDENKNIIENELLRNVKEIEEKIKTTSETLTLKIDNSIKEIAETINDMNSKYNEGIESIKNKTELLESLILDTNERIGLIDSKVINLEGNVSNHEEIISKVKNELEDITKEFNLIKKNWIINNQKIASLEKIIVQHSNELKELYASMNEYSEKKFNEIDNEINNLVSEIESINKANELYRERMDTIESQIADEIIAKLDKIDSEIIEINEWIKKFNTKTDDILNEIENNKNSANALNPSLSKVQEDKLRDLFDEIMKVINSVKDEYNARMSDLVDFVGFDDSKKKNENFVSLFEKISNNEERIIKLENLLALESAQIKSSLEGTNNTNIDELINKVENLIDGEISIKKEIQKLIDENVKIKDQLKESKDLIETNYDILSNFVNESNKKIDSNKEKIDRILNALSSGEASEELEKLSNIIKTIDDHSQEIEKIKEIISSISDPDLIKKFESKINELTYKNNVLEEEFKLHKNIFNNSISEINKILGELREEVEEISNIKLQLSEKVNSSDIKNIVIEIVNEIVKENISSLVEDINKFKETTHEERIVIVDEMIKFKEKFDIVESKLNLVFNSDDENSIISLLKKTRDELSEITKEVVDIEKAWLINNQKLVRMENLLLLQSEEMKEFSDKMSELSAKNIAVVNDLIKSENELKEEINILKQKDNEIIEEYNKFKNIFELKLHEIARNIKSLFNDYDEKVQFDIAKLVDDFDNKIKPNVILTKEEAKEIIVNYILEITNSELPKIIELLNSTNNQLNKTYEAWLKNNQQVSLIEDVILDQDKELRNASKKNFEEMQHISLLLDEINKKDNKNETLEMLRKINDLEDIIKNLEGRLSDSELKQAAKEQEELAIKINSENNELTDEIKDAILELVLNHKKRLI